MAVQGVLADSGAENRIADPLVQIDPSEFRSVLGHFCTGVTIVTAIGVDGPVGFTCQSFTSLSLDPPLIALNPSRTSTTWPVIRDARRFCVNVLAEAHEDLGLAFAQSGTDKFAGVSWSPSPGGSPILDGVLAWIDCTLQAEYDGGDHVIAVGAVRHLSASPATRPLLFYKGRFARATA